MAERGPRSRTVCVAIDRYFYRRRRRRQPESGAVALAHLQPRRRRSRPADARAGLLRRHRQDRAEVVATARAPSFDYLRSIGVTQIIDYRPERFEQRVHDVDVVIDPLGGDVQARSWSVLKRGGMLINLVGEINEAAARKAGVRGVEFGMEYDTEDLREIAALVERGTIKPHVTQVLPLDRAREAMDLNQQGKSHGKVVLEVPWGEARV